MNCQIKSYFQEFENSRLMELLPLDQKLQILNERLQATRNELRHERVQRQQIEQESTQLKASIVRVLL